MGDQNSFFEAWWFLSLQIQDYVAEVLKVSMYRYIGKLKEKWTHSDIKIFLECSVRCIDTTKSVCLKYVWLVDTRRDERNAFAIIVCLSKNHKIWKHVIKSWIKWKHCTCVSWGRPSNWSSSWSQKKNIKIFAWRKNR